MDERSGCLGTTTHPFKDPLVAWGDPFRTKSLPWRKASSESLLLESEDRCPAVRASIHSCSTSVVHLVATCESYESCVEVFSIVVVSTYTVISVEDFKVWSRHARKYVLSWNVLMYKCQNGSTFEKWDFTKKKKGRIWIFVNVANGTHTPRTVTLGGEGVFTLDGERGGLPPEVGPRWSVVRGLDTNPTMCTNIWDPRCMYAGGACSCAPQGLRAKRH